MPSTVLNVKELSDGSGFTHLMVIPQSPNMYQTDRQIFY